MTDSVYFFVFNDKTKMCWSKESSLTTFIVGMSACIYLYCRNKTSDRLYAIFFAFVLCMQFLEFLIWSDQPTTERDKTCKTAPYHGRLNNAASQVAALQNLLQPVVGGLLVLYFLSKSSAQTRPLKLVVGMYGAAIVAWVIMKRMYKQKLCTRPLSNGRHLQWPWITEKVAGHAIWYGYFATLAFVLVSMLKIPGGKTMAGYLVATMLVSMSVYPFKKAMGSWWCVAAVGGPLLKVAFPDVP
jgi:hypothetical protein